MALLEIHGLNKAFGGLQAVRDCSFHVEEGSITALIGPNGAGKTTAFNLISGVLRADSGRVIFRGEQIQHLPPHQITRRGMSRTFQISRNLEDLTVLENMIVQSPVHGWRGLLRRSMSAEERDRAMELLEFVGIAKLAHAETRDLSYGQKKLLDFASLLMSSPKLILLDEPAGGVNPALLESIMERITELNEQRGITFLIVEHNMELVMRISHSVVVMAYGSVIAQDAPDIVQNDPRVLQAYLGEVTL
ncbi:MAG: ABC transporter ATP-binding protein [Chloroflexi bacterium]|nr:MAG: ABC transporter ATP-binding protein [Chloroflexota bacterium]